VTVLRKALVGVEIKAADSRGARAIFSRYNLRDADGDVTEPGAFNGNGEIVVSAYGHMSWQGVLPVGKGRIVDQGGWAEADLEWLDTVGGRETADTIKQLGGLMQWSYGYDVLESAPGEFAGQQVRFLKRLKVYEVSPVLVGAGVNTRTLEASSRDAGLVELRRYVEGARHRHLAAIRARVLG
jgi:Caudovirus prohead serine protease